MKPAARFLFLSGAAHRALNPDAGVASGGAELQVALLAQELAARGFPTTIAASGEDFSDGTVWNGVRIRQAGPFASGGIGDTVRSFRPLMSVLREEQPSHVIIYGWTSWLAVLGLLKGGRFRTVYVCALDGELDGAFRRDHALRGRLLDFGISRADDCLGITESHLALFRERSVRAGLTRLLVKPRETPLPSGRTIDLLWVARCHPVKQPALFLDIADALPSAKCRMICSPQVPDLFEKIKSRANSCPNVDFVDGVPYREIQNHFDRARVFVNTSRDEGVPNTFIQSAQSGTAIASLRVDPDSAISRFGMGRTARGDFDALVRGIHELLEQPAALSAATAGTRSFLSAWHDNTANINAFLGHLGLEPHPTRL